MRKFLSLVLALVMVMSLTTLTAGAKEFTDKDSVTYGEAVDVISSLGIVDGYAGGEFGPSGILTRQAAAKIICNLILGPTTAHALNADVAPFPDVPTSSEFAGYIAFCAQRGIIGGYPDGTFRPGGSLTGFAFMKMLLGALGYDAGIEEFGGPNWSINVGKLAMGNGLDDGLVEGFDGTKAVTREEAALYALNTLEATMVTYGQKITIIGPDGKPQTVGYTKATNEAQGQYKSYDTPTADGSGTQRTLQFCERYFEDLTKTATNDDFGRPAHLWKIKTSEVGTYVNSDDLVGSWTAKVTKDALYNTLGKAVVDDLKDTDSATGELDYYVDGVQKANSINGTAIDNFAERKNTSKINGDSSDTGNGALTEAYLNKDTGDVTVVTISSYVFQATSDYSSSRDDVKIAAVGDTNNFISLDSYTLDGEDFDIADVKEDDYLIITAADTNNDGKFEVQSVKVAEQVAGEVTAYAVESKVTVDGTEYSYSLKTQKNGGVQSLIQTTGGQTALIMDPYGYVIAMDDTVVGGNYVFIAEAKGSTLLTSSSVVGHAFFADGTVEDVVIKKVDNNSNRAARLGAEGWYTYSKDSSNAYSLTSVSGSYLANHKITINSPTGAIVSNGNAALANFTGTIDNSADQDGSGTGVSGIKANERTIFVVQDNDGDVYSYTGVSNAPDINVTSGDYDIGYVWNKNTSFATYVFVSIDGNSNANVDSSTENDQYIFLLKEDSIRGSGDSTYYRYKAIVDGEETIIDTENRYNSNLFRLFTKVQVDNNNDRITGMREVRDSGAGASYATDVKYHYDDTFDGKVTYRNGVLDIDGTSFIVNADSQLNLIVGKGLADVLVDDGADYEVHSGTNNGANIASVINNYTVTGRYYVVTKDDYATNKTIKVLYLYVGTALSDEQVGDKTSAESGRDAIGNTYNIDAADTELTKPQAKAAAQAKIEAVVKAAPGCADATVAITWTDPDDFSAAVNDTKAGGVITEGHNGTISASKITVTVNGQSAEKASTTTFTLLKKDAELTNAEKLANAKTDVETALASVTFQGAEPAAELATLVSQITDAANTAIASYDGMTASYAANNTTSAKATNGTSGNAAAQAGAAGKVAGTITLTLDGDTTTVAVDKSIPAVAYGSSEQKKVDDAVTAIRGNIGTVNTATADDVDAVIGKIETAVDALVSGANVTGVDVSIVECTPGTFSAGGSSISVDITVTSHANTDVSDNSLSNVSVTLNPS